MSRKLKFPFLVFLLLGLSGQILADTPEQTRAAFLKILDRPAVPLRPEESNPKRDDRAGIVRIAFSFDSESGQRIPGILAKPGLDADRHPVVIVLHGTGGKKESHATLLDTLARRGYIAVAIDARHHGARATPGAGAKDYEAAIAQAFADGKSHPFLYDTVWDVMRLVDYLEKREDVDRKHIGLIGFSKGGMECYLTAAADTRIACAIPFIGVQSFKYALDNNLWPARIETIQAAADAAAKSAGVEKIDAAFVKKFYDRIVPGIYDQFDGPAMLATIAPRPLLVINGDQDPRTPVPAVELAADAAKKAYAAANAPGRFQLLIQKDTGHTVTAEAMELANKWLDKWLMEK